jgi:hypothetical protein
MKLQNTADNGFHFSKTNTLKIVLFSIAKSAKRSHGRADRPPYNEMGFFPQGLTYLGAFAAGCSAENIKTYSFT